VADRYQYLVLMAACVLITLPLEFVLRARIYRRPRRYLVALLPVVVVFSIWDVVAIAREHWWYSPAYTTGVILPAGLPLEELVFFVVIPTCGLLTYEAVGTVLGWVRGWRGRARQAPDRQGRARQARPRHGGAP
jgi:lycopene cyclase domain-containing protein